ncbi:PrsW family intramembrane metalloprotease [Gordonia sp. NPDC003424]
MTTNIDDTGARNDSVDLNRARYAAIEESGRGAGFRFIQPRNFCWWAYLVLMAFGAFTTVTIFAAPWQAFGDELGSTLIVLTVYGVLLWWFTRYIDRYSQVPGKLVLAALAWGGIGATMGIAINANDPIRSLYAKAFGQRFSAEWSAGLTAPVTEEFAKGLGVVLLIYLAPKVIRTAFDGFIVGAFCGLGFQVVEDVLYSFNIAGSHFGADAGDLGFNIALFRMLTGLSGHILFSAIFGAGIVYLLGRPGEPRNVARGLGFLVLPMVMHWFWDSIGALLPTASETMQIVELMVVVLVYLAIVIWVFHLVVGRERDHLRAILAPEVAGGVLTEEELTAITGDWKQRRHFRGNAGDRAGRRHARWVTEAATELADALARSRGVTTPEVEFERAEVTRLRGEVGAAV